MGNGPSTIKGKISEAADLGWSPEQMEAIKKVFKVSLKEGSDFDLVNAGIDSIYTNVQLKKSLSFKALECEKKDECLEDLVIKLDESSINSAAFLVAREKELENIKNELKNSKNQNEHLERKLLLQDEKITKANETSTDFPSESNH